MGAFIIFQLSRSVCVSAANVFKVRIKIGKQQYYKKHKRIRCFSVIVIAEC